MPSISKILKQIDIFGFQVSLNFNRKGSVHNTAIGGFFSLMIGGLISYLGYTNLLLMFTFSNPSLSIVQQKVDFSKQGTTNFENINILIFY